MELMTTIEFVDKVRTMRDAQKVNWLVYLISKLWRRNETTQGCIAY